jgi:predicted PurR-regulated permease PerM
MEVLSILLSILGIIALLTFIAFMILFFSLFPQIKKNAREANEAILEFKLFTQNLNRLTQKLMDRADDLEGTLKTARRGWEDLLSALSFSLQAGLTKFAPVAGIALTLLNIFKTLKKGGKNG